VEFRWIPVEWNLAEGPANLFIPVFSIPVEFRWIPEFTPECSPEWRSPEWAGTEFHWNPFDHLLRIIVCLFVMANKQYLFGNHAHQTRPLSSSHHHQQCSSPPPPFVTAHDGLNDVSTTTNGLRSRPQTPQQEVAAPRHQRGVPGATSPRATWQPNDDERRQCRRSLLLFILSSEYPVHLRPIRSR
jgi:hypothetical protein